MRLPRYRSGNHLVFEKSRKEVRRTLGDEDGERIGKRVMVQERVTKKARTTGGFEEDEPTARNRLERQ